MLIACVLMKHFSYHLEGERRPHLKGRDLFVIAPQGHRRVVLDASPALKGVTQGMSLEDAQARAPLALLLEADPAYYQQRYEEIVIALEQVSPVVEPGELGCAYVGLDGLAGMYGGGAGVVQALRATVPDHLEPRFGIGSGKFPATIAALAAGPGQAQEALEDLRAYLAPHPVDVLPVSWDVLERLKRLGLRKLGDLARQRVGPMQAQFGPEGRRLWEMAQGIDTRPLVARKHEERYSERLAFPSPTVTLETLLVGVERLLGRLFRRKELQGRYTRVALLEATLSRRPRWQRRLAFKEAVGSPAAALPAFKRVLSLYPPPGPVEELTITLTGITGEAGRQGSLFQEVRRRDQLRETLTQLEARIGPGPHLYQVREVEPWSRLPERRRVLVESVP